MFPSKVPILQTWFTNCFNWNDNSCWKISPPIWFKGWLLVCLFLISKNTQSLKVRSLSCYLGTLFIFSPGCFFKAVFPPGFFYILRLRSRIAAAPTNCPICSSINQRPLRSKLPGKTELCHELTDHHWVNFYHFLPFLHLRSKLPRKKNFVANHHWVIFTIFAKNSSQIIIGSIFPPRVKKNTNNCKYLNAFRVSFEFVFVLLFVIMTTLIISSVLVVVVIYWLLHRDP